MCMHSMLYIPVDISAALTTNRLQLPTVFYMQPVAFDKHVNLLYNLTIVSDWSIFQNRLWSNKFYLFSQYILLDKIVYRHKRICSKNTWWVIVIFTSFIFWTDNCFNGNVNWSNDFTGTWCGLVMSTFSIFCVHLGNYYSCKITQV